MSQPEATWTYPLFARNRAAVLFEKEVEIKFYSHTLAYRCGYLIAIRLIRLEPTGRYEHGAFLVVFLVFALVLVWLRKRN